jgi:hypothetical protein
MSETTGSGKMVRGFAKQTQRGSFSKGPQWEMSLLERKKDGLAERTALIVPSSVHDTA